jgi:hypothetical protein
MNSLRQLWDSLSEIEGVDLLVRLRASADADVTFTIGAFRPPTSLGAWPRGRSLFQMETFTRPRSSSDWAY